MKASQQKETKGGNLIFQQPLVRSTAVLEVLPSGEELLSHSCGAGVFESSNHEQCTQNSKSKHGKLK